MSIDTKNLLKELVAAPFGQAEKICREKGFWDEKRVPKAERDQKEYEVTLIGMKPVYAIVTVFAEDETEAKKLASEEAMDCSWEDDDGGFVENVEIEGVVEVDD